MAIITDNPRISWTFPYYLYFYSKHLIIQVYVNKFTHNAASRIAYLVSS